MKLILTVAAGVLVGLLAFIGLYDIYELLQQRRAEDVALSNLKYLRIVDALDCGKVGAAEVLLGDGFPQISPFEAETYMLTLWKICIRKRQDITTIALRRGEDHIGYYDPVKGLYLFQY